jgi:hypothetical protein
MVFLIRFGTLDLADEHEVVSSKTDRGCVVVDRYDYDVDCIIFGACGIADDAAILRQERVGTTKL